MEGRPVHFTYPPGTSLYHCLDHLLARPMFVLAFVYLVAFGGLLHRLEVRLAGWPQESEIPIEALLHEIQINGPELLVDHTKVTFIELYAMVSVVVLLWPIFVAEGILRFFMRANQVGFWTRFGVLILTMLLPPVRMGARSYLDTNLIWFPFIGWNHVDKHLRRRLEKAFSVPMIVIALMVLPFLAMEHFWEERVNQSFGLAMLLDIGTAVIWTAFALELIIMLAVARNKMTYCVQHWIDVAVVLLPILDFLPMLRLIRIGKLISLQKLSRVGRIYRLRGLLMKAWRSFLVLEVLQRLFNNSPEKRLRKLYELMHAKEEELEELRMEIEELQREMANKKEELEEIME